MKKKDETALAKVEDATPTDVTLFGAGEPEAVLAKMTDVSRTLASVIKTQGLSTKIQGKDYVLAEGWTTLAGMLNLAPCTVWTRRVADYPVEAWEARVEVYHNGQIRGAAEALCGRDEPSWKGRPSYALRSMAQTRAMAKALRLPLGFIMKLAGFEATPADEMTDITPSDSFPTSPESVSPIADGPTKIIAAEVEKRTPKWTKYRVGFDNGDSYAFFDEGLFEKAKVLMERKTPVNPVTERKGQYTNLVDLLIAEEYIAEITDGEVIEDENDLPF